MSMKLFSFYHLNCKIDFDGNTYVVFTGQYIGKSVAGDYLILGHKHESDTYCYNFPHILDYYLNLCSNISVCKLIQHSLYRCSIDEIKYEIF